MRHRIALAAALVLALAAGCGGGAKATGSAGSPSTRPTSEPAPSTASSAIASSSVPADPASAARARLQDFVGTTKGVSGHIDLVENDGSSGTLHLSGTFGLNLASADPSAQLQLQAILTTPVPIGIRLAGGKVYFQQKSQAWMALSDVDSSPAGAADLRLAALLLAGITPATWSGLVDDDSARKAATAATDTTLTGSVEAFSAGGTLTTYSANAPVQVSQQWPSPVTYLITTDGHGRLTKAHQLWRGSGTSASLSITVTGYTSPPVSAPPS